tara:strand:- start:9248 stop:9772 length:525 start_codon:yes stop_codon:yes gene_type:complete
MVDDNDQPQPAEEDALTPSKSARKRQMHALQRLGESLLELSESQLDALSLDEPALLTALQETRRIRSNSARKRHLQYIGKLMRNIDPEPIEAALAALHARNDAATREFHELEQLRNAILDQPEEGMQLAVARYPDVDRQQLRQLIRQHASEQRLGKAPTASRKLFRYLRDLAGD